jgi:hypothetical protein|tara:strand:- start:177 stop:413 length:237 start_codon:yes stop_codon:yes gene_type:complete
MSKPEKYLVEPTTGVDQSMVESLAKVLEVMPHQIIETALHEWLEANFMRINSLHRNAQQIHDELNPKRKTQMEQSNTN